MEEPGLDNKDLFQPDGAPDWNAIPFDVLCSRCGYNLRTLTRPKCPECGLEFGWREIVAAKALESDFLFEHHWRRRPVRSLFKTVWRSLRPRAFWSSVSIHQEVRPRPLWFLVLIAPLFLWVPMLVVVMGTPPIIEAILPPTGSPSWWKPTSFQQSLVRIWSFYSYEIYNPFTGPVDVWLPVAASAFIPFLTMIGVLCGLRQTLAKCRVRPVQMFRVVAYSAIPACFCCAIALLIITWIIWLIPYDHALRREFIVQPVIFVFPVLILAYYARSGLKHYLQLPRPGQVAFTAAFIGQLAMANYFGAIMFLQLTYPRWFPTVLRIF